MTATLHLMHGFIGSGKTTYARQLEQQHKALRLSLDRWAVALLGPNPPEELFRATEKRIHDLQTELASQLLARGVDVVLDWGLWKRTDRDALRALARTLGVHCILYASTTAREVMKTRALARNAQMDGETMLIDENTFEVLWPFFEPLQADEEAVLF